MSGSNIKDFILTNAKQIKLEMIDIMKDESIFSSLDLLPIIHREDIKETIYTISHHIDRLNSLLDRKE